MIRRLFRRANRYMPFVNFAVSFTALTFQTTVLYPWHEELSKELKLLKETKDLKSVKSILI
jgi:hypothetical protein